MSRGRHHQLRAIYMRKCIGISSRELYGRNTARFGDSSPMHLVSVTRSAVKLGIHVFVALLLTLGVLLPSRPIPLFSDGFELSDFSKRYQSCLRCLRTIRFFSMISVFQSHIPDRFRSQIPGRRTSVSDRLVYSF